MDTKVRVKNFRLQLQKNSKMLGDTIADAVKKAVTQVAVPYVTVPQKFQKYADILIDNIEGGYYNPDWHYTPAMKKSGETMFGMDRENGKDLFKSGIGKTFWDFIDTKKNKEEWKHGFMAKGKDYEKTLRTYAAKIMYDQFVLLANKFLKGNRQIIENDDCLTLHFYYACWNGSGRFQKFAKVINDEIKRENGKIDINLLRVCALNSRINSGNDLISKGGKKIQNLWKKYFGLDVQLTPELLKPSSNAWIWWLVGGVALVGCGVGFYYWKLKK